MKKANTSAEVENILWVTKIKMADLARLKVLSQISFVR